MKDKTMQPSAEKVREFALDIYKALKKVGSRGAMISGSPDNKEDYYGTLIDGEFDLTKVAQFLMENYSLSQRTR